MKFVELKNKAGTTPEITISVHIWMKPRDTEIDWQP